MANGVVPDSKRQRQHRKERILAIVTSVLFDFAADNLTLEQVKNLAWQLDKICNQQISSSMQIDIHRE